MKSKAVSLEETEEFVRLLKDVNEALTSALYHALLSIEMAKLGYWERASANAELVRVWLEQAEKRLARALERA